MTNFEILLLTSISFFVYFSFFYYILINLGGGCNCSRSNFAGALLGAHFGLQYPVSSTTTTSSSVSIGDGESKAEGDAVVREIPLEWMKKTDKISEYIFLAIERVACV